MDNKDRKKIKSIIVIVAMMICIIVFFAGCSNAQEKNKVRIVLMNGWGGATEDHVAMREIYEEFNIQNPDIELVLDTSTDLSIVIRKAKEMLAVDKMPNIISTNGSSDFIDYANRKGYATDLMPYIKDDPQLAGYIPKQVYQNWEKDGKLYTIPDVIEMSGYWYNKDIFKEASITKAPETWDEFWLACDMIDAWSEREQNGIVPVVMESNQAALAFLGARIAGDSSAGTGLMLGVPETFNHTLLIAALDDLVRIYSYSEEKKSNLNLNDSLNSFNKEKAAMYFNGVWANAQIDNNIEVRTANYPGYDGKSVAYISTSSGYVIGNNEGQEKIDASIRFLKYILSDEIQYKILTQTKQAPSNPNVNYEDAMDRVPLLTDAINTIDKAQVTINTLRTAWGDEYISIIQDNLEQLINGELTSRQLLKKLEDERKNKKSQQ